MATKTISFRAQLKGTISDFLKKERMTCPHTEEGLLELVVSLSNYTEEGHALFPEVVICDDLPTTISLLQCSDALLVGTGTRTLSTFSHALKKCAPLARAGWVVYVLRQEKDIEYGVFRAPPSPTALDIRDTVLSLSKEKRGPQLIYASQLAEKVVELVGAKSGVMHIHLSATPDDSPPPRDAIDGMVRTACADIDVSEKEQVESYMRTTLSNALRQGHGALIGVLKSGSDPKGVSTDGVHFPQPISLTDLVKAHEKNGSGQTLGSLTAYAGLLTGMLGSDGIVLIDSQARLVGYNLFVKSSTEDKAPGELLGGARRRAFKALQELVTAGKLEACFIRSSDGATECCLKEAKNG